jgi:hypothetical protein
VKDCLDGIAVNITALGAAELEPRRSCEQFSLVGSLSRGRRLSAGSGADKYEMAINLWRHRDKDRKRAA